MVNTMVLHIDLPLMSRVVDATLLHLITFL